MKKNLFFCSLLALAAACNPAAEDPAEIDAGSVRNVYQDAVGHPERFPDDLERDVTRKPAEILEFMQVKPGMKVLDLFSGGGYYTEIISRVVGDKGAVVAQTNKAYQAFASGQTTPRYADDRLANVSILMAENNELSLPANEFDVIMMVLSYHDIYFVNESSGWPKLDGPKLLAELYKGARPGGVLGIIDHSAAPGSPRETGGTTHRIDRDIVVREVEETGFKLEASSDLLRNTEDDYSRNVFEADLRGKTDRFVLRFRKPG